MFMSWRMSSLAKGICLGMRNRLNFFCSRFNTLTSFRVKLKGKMNIFFRRANAGVLLLEALLAVVILSVALVTVVQSMATSARALNDSLEYVRAVTLLENQLFELMRNPAAKLPAFEERVFETPHQDFQYRYTLSLMSGEDSKFLRQLDLDVLWGPSERQKRLPLVTYLLRSDEGADDL